jgi:hypothetical protein
MTAPAVIHPTSTQQVGNNVSDTQYGKHDVNGYNNSTECYWRVKVTDLSLIDLLKFSQSTHIHFSSQLAAHP